jgi:hypothetical protein
MFKEWSGSPGNSGSDPGDHSSDHVQIFRQNSRPARGNPVQKAHPPPLHRRPGPPGALLSCLLLLGGCGFIGGQDVGQRTAQGGSSGRPITVDELDQITKSFADRYVLLLANACDMIKKGAATVDERRNAHRLKLTGATAAFDAATGPDPVKQLVDLAVGVELQKIVWVDEGQAERFFGTEQTGRLAEALGTAQTELWGLCTRAMRPEQIHDLQQAIRVWRRDNPGLPWISDVRFDVVVGNDGATLIDGILGTLSPASGMVTDSVGQARLLGQRAFYYLKRLPRLMDWQMEATLDTTLTAPEAGSVVRGVSQTLESAAGLLSRLNEFMAPSTGRDGRSVDPTVHEIRQIISEAKDLARAAREAAVTFAGLRTGSSSTEVPSASFERTEKEATNGFDIKEYTRAGAQFAETIREANDLLRAARGLAESEPAMRQVGISVESAVRGIARQRLNAIDHTVARIAEVIILSTLLLSLYTAFLFWLRRRAGAAISHPGS